MTLIVRSFRSSQMATVTQIITLGDVVGMAVIVVRQLVLIRHPLRVVILFHHAKIHRPVRISVGVLRDTWSFDHVGHSIEPQ